MPHRRLRLTHSRPPYNIQQVQTGERVYPLREEAVLTLPFGTLLQDHDVYITDWHNARDVSLLYGGFSLDDYVTYLMRFTEAIGPGSHMVAVCQPCVAAPAATALMAEDDHPDQPRSLTLMAGPVDCRVNPTEVNRLATSKPIEWFEKNLISHVPLPSAAPRS